MSASQFDMSLLCLISPAYCIVPHSSVRFANVSLTASIESTALQDSLVYGRLPPASWSSGYSMQRKRTTKLSEGHVGDSETIIIIIVLPV